MSVQKIELYGEMGQDQKNGENGDWHGEMGQDHPGTKRFELD